MELTELLMTCGRQLNQPGLEGSVYSRMRFNPDNYEIVSVVKRIEQKKLGESGIPKNGVLIIYVDNSSWKTQKHLYPDLELMFPELNHDCPTAVCDLVNDVSLRNGHVELTIDRYVVQEKQLARK